MAGVELRTTMVLAAGLGLRMRPLSGNLPKPLVPVLGQPMIDRGIAHLREAGVARIVVNVHYRADAMAAHLEGCPGVVLSHEPELLETGGGVKKALPALGDKPFYVVNSDALWLDGPTPALRRLAAAWNDDTMDALLLLQASARIFADTGFGDYHLDPLGRAARRGEREVAPFLFGGVQILHPRLFADSPDGPFSLNLLYDRAEAAGRLYGLVHDGEWYHVGTPEQLALAEDAIVQGHAFVNSR